MTPEAVLQKQQQRAYRKAGQNQNRRRASDRAGSALSHTAGQIKPQLIQLFRRELDADVDSDRTDNDRQNRNQNMYPHCQTAQNRKPVFSVAHFTLHNRTRRIQGDAASFRQQYGFAVSSQGYYTIRSVRCQVLSERLYFFSIAASRVLTARMSAGSNLNSRP